jgi:hypothetical protein
VEFNTAADWVVVETELLHLPTKWAQKPHLAAAFVWANTGKARAKLNIIMAPEIKITFLCMFLYKLITGSGRNYTILMQQGRVMFYTGAEKRSE